MRSRGASLFLTVAVTAAIGACTGGPAPTPTPPTEPITSAIPSEPVGTAAAPTEPSSTGTPATEAPPTEAPGETPLASLSASGGPPSVDTMQVIRTASCASDNGTGTTGMVRITWTASGTTGVRISIDPPSAGVAYDYPFADYPASGFADVPFACDPPNSDTKGEYHLYVVSTLKVAGHTFYRFAKVYAATPSPT